MPDGSIPRSVIFIVAMILAGGFFSAAETALSFCNTIRLRLMAENGDARARKAVLLLDQFDQAVVAFLVAINIIHVVLASFSTMLAISLIGPAGSTAATIISTLLVFIFSETLPKSIAKANSNTYVLFCAPVFLFVIRLFRPAVFVLTSIGELAKRLFHISEEKTAYTEEELISMLDYAEKDGLIDETEKKLIHSSITFNDMSVASIMTRRDKVQAIPDDIEPEKLKQYLITHSFSRYPIYHEELDHVIGTVRADQCLLDLSCGEKFDLAAHTLPPLELPPQTCLADAFESMGQKRNHFAILRAEGKLLGIVTMDDILGGLTGEREETELLTVVGQ